MPTTLIAERIGWDQPIHVLSNLVTELRSAYSPPYRDISQARSFAGETVQCGLWFPGSRSRLAMARHARLNSCLS